MAQLENIEAIEKRLWNAADHLRANSNFASNLGIERAAASYIDRYFTRIDFPPRPACGERVGVRGCEQQND